MLKGQVFAEQLFENQIFALFINTFLDGKNGIIADYKNGMAVTYSGSNVSIDSGTVCIQGIFLDEDTSTTLTAGTDTMYCKLVIEIDLDKTNTESNFEQGYYKIVKSASGYPTLTQSDIVNTNSGVYQYELARFRTSANGISDFQDMRSFIDYDSIYEEIERVIEEIKDTSDLVFKDDVKGTVLYENSSGTTADIINFSENISEGDLIEIIFGRIRVNGTIILKSTGKIPYYSGMVMSLDMLYNAVSGMEFDTKRITITDSGLTTEDKANDFLVITKIISYKY